MPKPRLKLIPLGGLGEIGKNMMVVEYGDDMIIIDCGLMFPEEEMLGIDLVIPDTSYVTENVEKLRGIVITHGHEDHIGALPYLLPQLEGAPVYSSRLTNGLIKVKIKERWLKGGTTLNYLPYGEMVRLGVFSVELFPVCHSIPDAAGVIIRTPEGAIVHSGDFKIDYTPVSGTGTDLSRLAQLGAEGVLLLLSDSTYAELPGYTPSEITVGRALDQVITNAKGRVIVTTFSSLISRIQQVIDAAARHDRRVFIVGRSMSDSVKIALELGYLCAPEGLLGRIDEVKSLPPEKIVLVTTGSQGEPTSALVRMANHDHRHVHIQEGDTIVLSATPVPGNESLVNRTVAMIGRYLEGRIPALGELPPADRELRAAAEAAVERYHATISGLHFDEALAEVMSLTAAANGYAESQAPWTLNKRGESERLGQVLAVMAETCRLLGHMMAPFTPAASRAIHEQLGIAPPYDERGEGGPGLRTLLAWEGGADALVRSPTGEPTPVFPRTELPEAAS